MARVNSEIKNEMAHFRLYSSHCFVEMSKVITRASHVIYMQQDNCNCHQKLPRCIPPTLLSIFSLIQFHVEVSHIKQTIHIWTSVFKSFQKTLFRVLNTLNN